MAESSTTGGSNVNDFLAKKRAKLAAQEGKKPVRRLKKRVARPNPMAPTQKKDTLGLMSSARFAGDFEQTDERLVRKPAPGRKLKRPPGAVGAPKRRLVKKKIRRKLTPEEIEARRLKKEAEAAEAEAEAKIAAMSEEEKEQFEQEQEQKRLEEEKKKKEEEEKLKLEEEERLKKEKEEEEKRLEDEKKRQEEERERIYKKIEFYKNNLNAEEAAIAEKIASEMVRRNIKWNGYISLHSGIGGAMLRD